MGSGSPGGSRGALRVYRPSVVLRSLNLGQRPARPPEEKLSGCTADGGRCRRRPRLGPIAGLAGEPRFRLDGIEGIGQHDQRDRAAVTILEHARIDEEADRHLDALARLQGLLAETEALDLVEEAAG